MKISHIFRFITAIVLGTYLTLLVTLDFEAIQSKLGDIVSERVSEILKSEVHIDKVQVGLFDHVSLRGVMLKDQDGEPLLQANYLSAKISIIPLLKGEIALRSLALLDTDVRLYKADANATPNYQFLIDALSSKDDSPSQLNLSIGSIIMRRCNVRYDQDDIIKRQGVFDIHHLNINDIDANISLKALKQDSLNLRIRTLRVKEASGLAINELTCNLTANTKEATLHNLNLVLNHSYLKQDKLHLTYDANRLLETLSFRGKLTGGRISTSDFSALVPVLKDANLALGVSTDYEVTPKSIKLSNLRIADSKDLQLEANVVVNRAHNSQENKADRGAITEVFTELVRLRINTAAASRIVQKLTSTELPQLVENLSYIEASGKGEWHTGKRKSAVKHTDKDAGTASMKVDLATAVGKVSIDAQYARETLHGNLSTERISLAKLLGQSELPENITLESKYDLDLRQLTGSIESLIKAFEWDKKRYSNINLQAKWDNKAAALSIDAHDNNANLIAKIEGTAKSARTQSPIWENLGNDLSLKGFVNVATLKLPSAYIPEHLQDAEVRGNLDFDISGLDVEQHNNKPLQPKGFASLTGINIVTSESQGSTSIPLGDIMLSLRPKRDAVSLKIDSDIVRANYDGKLNLHVFETILDNLLANKTEDSSKGINKDTYQRATGEENTHLALQFTPNQAFRDLTGVDIHANTPINLLGNVTNGGTQAIFTLDAPHLDIAGTELKNLRLMAQTDKNDFACLGSVKKQIGTSIVQIEVHAESQASRLSTELIWDDGDKHRYFGNIKMLTEFARKPHQQNSPHGHRQLSADFFTPLEVTLLPTSLVISDTIWNINKGSLSWDGRQLDISGFRIATEDNRSIAINGTLSDKEDRTLKIDLNDIDVDYILNIVDFDDVSFGGLATGSATMRLIDGTPDVDGLLHIPDFKFNGGDMGDADIGIRWDGAEKSILFDASMSYPEDKGSLTKVDGWVSPAKEGLDLHINCVRSKIQFLRPYIGDIFEDLDGKVTGDVRVFGKFETIDFEGKVTADASASIKQTGVKYNISGANVEIIPGTFRFVEANLTDGFGGTGSAKGELRHNHLKNFNFNVNLQGQKLLFYDKVRELDMPFYAHVVASGDVDLEGTPDAFGANIRITPDFGTTMTYIMDTPETYGSGSLLTYQEAVSQDEADSPNYPLLHSSVETGENNNTPSQTTNNGDEEAKTDVRLNFAINTNPNATLNILMDDRTGDHISVKGHGMIQASWYNKGDLKMYGTYIVDSGIYNLSIQKLIHKKFDLISGGSIVFAGDPLDSDLNFKASYLVNSASLSDLNISTLSSKNIRVNCILNITGKPSSVGVNFDIDLPTTSEEEKQMVRSLISSEEDMTTQVLYLLGFGRFYNYNYEATTTGGQSQTSTLMNSFLSNTLSSQFNNLLSNAIGSRNWTFGANVATGNIGWSDVAVEGLLSGRLFDNRLLLNGNFGYRERKTSTQNGFVGDFDIQYLLTPQGSARLKAYSETNDRYFIKNASTTQGIGIVLQRDFTSILDLFGITKKKEKKTLNK